MLNKISAIFLVFVLCTSLLLTGCSQSEAGTSTEAGANAAAPSGTATAPTGATGDAPAEYDLKFSTFVQEGEKNAQVAKHWIELVEERTNGKVKVTPYWGESFASNNEHPSLISSGALDLAMFPPNINVAIMPLNSLVTYNISHGFSREQLVAASQMLQFEIPETVKILQAEETRLNIKFLAPQVNGCEGVIAKKSFNTLDDMKGWKVTSEGALDKVWSNLGLAPVYVNVPDLYQSFSSGVVDAVHLITVPITQLKLHEQGICYREWVNYYMLGLPITVNLTLWNKLPADIQDIFTQASKECATYSIELDKKEIETAWQTMKDKGVDIGYFSQEDTNKFIDNSKTITVDQVWMECADKLGCGDDAKVLLDKWVELLKS